MNPAFVLMWILLAMLLLPPFGYVCIKLWVHAYYSGRIKAFRDNDKPLNEGETDATPKSS